jgi:hypothetical protein
MTSCPNPLSRNNCTNRLMGVQIPRSPLYFSSVCRSIAKLGRYIALFLTKKTSRRCRSQPFIDHLGRTTRILLSNSGSAVFRLRGELPLTALLPIGVDLCVARRVGEFYDPIILNPPAPQNQRRFGE